MANKIEKDLEAYLKAKGEGVSKAQRLQMLIKLEKKLFGAKQKMVDYKEPILFLIRRTGDIEFYEGVTQGKFVYAHSSGEQRWMEIRPQDQMKFQYADRRVRCYIGHEDRPFTGFDSPVIDTESLVVAVNRVSATKQKYEESLAKLKQGQIKTWMYVAFGIAGAVALIVFALGTWGQPLIDAFANRGAEAAASAASSPAPTIPGFAAFFGRKVFKKRRLD